MIQGYGPTGGLEGKASACNAGDPGSISGLRRSPREGKGYPLQYSGVENSIDSPWGCRVGHHRVTFTFTFPPALQADSLPTEPQGSPTDC